MYVGLLLMLWRYPGADRLPAAARRAATRRCPPIEFVPRRRRYRALRVTSSANCAPPRTVDARFSRQRRHRRAGSFRGRRDVARETDALRRAARISRLRRTPGAPTYAGSALDARAALDFLQRHGSASRRPTSSTSVTRSAAPIAAELAARDTPRALVLQSPFSSARAMAASHVRAGHRGVLAPHFARPFRHDRRAFARFAPRCGSRTAIAIWSFRCGWAARCSPRPSTKASC